MVSNIVDELRKHIKRVPLTMKPNRRERERQRKRMHRQIFIYLKFDIVLQTIIGITLYTAMTSNWKTTENVAHRQVGDSRKENNDISIPKKFKWNCSKCGWIRMF